MSDFLNYSPELLRTLFDSSKNSNRFFELQQLRIVSLGRKIQCPYFQEHREKKRGPARQEEINLDKFRKRIFF